MPEDEHAISVEIALGHVVPDTQPSFGGQPDLPPH
jgi:hypothetical protein